MPPVVTQLAACFEIGRARYTRQQLESRFGDAAAALIGDGIFSGPLHPATAVCRCPEGSHMARIGRQDEAGRYRAHCPDGDKYWIEAACAETHAFNPDIFSKRVSEAFAIAERKDWDVEAQRCYYLCDAQFGTTRFPLFLARHGRSAATLAAAQRLSRQAIGKTKGLILFSGPTPADCPADEFHAWAKMEDILDYADGRLRICPAAVRSALGCRIVPLSSTEVRARLFDAIDQYAAAFAKLPSSRALSSHVADSWPVDQAPPMKGRCEGALKAYAARHGASRR